MVLQMKRLFLAVTLCFIPIVNSVAQQVNIYSFRQDFLVEPLLDEFENKTGILVNIVSGNADVIIKRLKAEGERSYTDLLLTVDAGRLERAKQLGLLQDVQSAYIEDVLPAQFRDPKGAWFGLSARARPIIYNKDTFDPSLMTSYADLADEKWRGRVCVRSSMNVYNQSMVAGYLAHHGEEKTRQWLVGLRKNLAQRPQGSDVDQIKYVAAGTCDISFVNMYYLARMLESRNSHDRSIAEQVGIIWPDQKTMGTHINISGVAVTKYAPNKESAVKFIEFLLSKKAQKIYAEQVLEYPVIDGVEVSPVIAGMGAFKRDELALGLLGQLNEQAYELMKEAGWD